MPAVHKNNGETASQRWPSSSGSWRQTSMPLSLYNPPIPTHPPHPNGNKLFHACGPRVNKTLILSDARRVRGGWRGRPCHVVAGRSSEFHQSAVFCWGFKAIKISPASDEFTVQCDCNVTIDGYFTHTPSPLHQDSRSLLSSCRNTSKLLRSLPAYAQKKKQN